MAWYSWVGKAAAAKANSQAESAAAKTDLQNARKSVSSAVTNAGGSVKNDIEATGQNLEATAEETSNVVEQAAGNTKDNAATAPNAKVEKTKHKRPGISSHESVGDKFKHAFKIDHKQHHPQQANAPATGSDV